MCRDLDDVGFAKNAGIPMDLSRLFANPFGARDWCRSSKKSLNSGYNKELDIDYAKKLCVVIGAFFIIGGIYHMFN